jgi:hypothetical protein
VSGLQGIRLLANCRATGQAAGVLFLSCDMAAIVLALIFMHCCTAAGVDAVYCVQPNSSIMLIAKDA